MQNTSKQWLAACAMSILSCAAQAGAVTASIDRHNAIGGDQTQATWRLSNAAVAEVNASKSRLASGTPGVDIVETLNLSGTQVKAISVRGLPLQSITYDSASSDILGAQYGGTLKIVAPDTQNFVATGGAFSISDIRLDLVARRAYATIWGDNGVGEHQNVWLWDLDAATGNTKLSNAFIYPLADGIYAGLSPEPIVRLDLVNFSIPHLRLTQEGLDLWVQSSGYTKLGRTMLQTVSDFGEITTSAVPEASTYGMVLVGLVLVGAGRRRMTGH